VLLKVSAESPHIFVFETLDFVDQQELRAVSGVGKLGQPESQQPFWLLHPPDLMALLGEIDG